MPNKPRNCQLLVIVTFTDSCKIHVKGVFLSFIISILKSLLILALSNVAIHESQNFRMFV